jgi:hypothetical protein
MGLSRLAEMLCTLLLLIQIFIPDAATLAADIQTRAYRPAKAYKLGS